MLLTSTVYGQGTLTPPGAPAPTMKTLSQVEPRIDVSTLPNVSGYVISQPGSYYMSSNSTIGIRIQSSFVTLDMMGFSLINAVITATNVGTMGNVIKNGSLQSPPGSGINTWNTTSSFTMNGRIENVMVYNSSGSGFRLGRGWTAVNCTARDNNSFGFSSLEYATLENCLSISNGTTVASGFSIGSFSRVINCTAEGNAENGIRTGDGCLVFGFISDKNTTTGIAVGNHCIVRDSTSRNNLGSGFLLREGSVIENSLADNNGNYGFTLIGKNLRASGCNASGNTLDGFNADDNSIIVDSIASDNGGTGFATANDSILRNCIATTNGSHGFSVNLGSVITGCIADSNQSSTTNSHGFLVTGWAHMTDNLSIRNQGDGIKVIGSQCTIDKNTVRANTGLGINLAANNNIVTRNVVKLNTGGDINFAGGGVAPLTTPAAATNPFSNLQ